jgi:hypothetical protein
MPAAVNAWASFAMLSSRAVARYSEPARDLCCTVMPLNRTNGRIAHPRLMSGKDATAYCSVTPETFSKWVAAGVMPKAVIGRRWDKKAIDLALDKLSGITTANTELDEELAVERAWEAKYEARKAAWRERS